jgi:pyruvate ferredoxin oxidoreductase gamma subunit
MKKPYTEIRWHARGGQGAKTAATLVAEMAINEGKYSQGFPEYGPERMGAPIRGFTRIGESPISVHSAIYEPEIVVVLDDSLLDTVDVCEGMRDDGILLVNTSRAPEEIRAKLSNRKVKLHTIDATKISIEELGRPIPNAPMMGALSRTAGVVKLDTVKDSMAHKFEKKFGDKVVQGNLRAIERAYKEVKS